MTPILGIIASSKLKATTSFESIATVSVGSGGQTDIVFSSIPSTYKHLQIRGIGRRTDAQAYYDNILYYFNTDSTASNYYRHLLIGDGSSVAAAAANGRPAVVLPGNSQTANVFGAFIIDILDYASTSKYKTVRTIGGVETNGSDSEIRFQSGLWKDTSAINQITFPGNSGFTQYTSIALYGIKD